MGQHYSDRDGPAARVHTGWRWVEPGACGDCGATDGYVVDGRGNVMCECAACVDCGIVDAYGFHEAGCGALTVDAEGV